MTIRLRMLILAAAIAWSLAPAAQAQGYSRAAQRVISQSLAATGGRGWLLLRGWHEIGRRGDVPYEAWIDPVRYGLRMETGGAGGLRIRGFNGQADWQVAPTGEMSAVNDHPTLAEQRTAAFFAGHCFFFPGRFGARGDLLGVRAHAGRTYEVVVVTPWNGEPRELWFDAKTHLLGRIVDRTGPRARPLSVSDYRKVGPVVVAFRYASEPGAAPSPDARAIESLSFTPADRGLFSLDRDAALAKVRGAAPPMEAVRPASAPPPHPPLPARRWWMRRSPS